MQPNELRCDLPQLGLKGDMTGLWQYGGKRFRKNLREVLTAFGDFYVTSRKAEKHLGKVQDSINSGGNPGDEGTTAMHYIVLEPQSVDLLLGLLSLGLDPDVSDEQGRTPSHYFGLSATPSPGGAMALLDCRPNVTALAKSGFTPEETVLQAEAAASAPVLKHAYKAVASYLHEGGLKSYPSLAQLAFEQKCYAVKNLCRRRVFTIDDVRGIYNGRTAVQWAEAWNEFDLAEEMRYFFQPSSSHQLTPGVFVPINAPDNGLVVAVKQEVDVETAVTNIGQIKDDDLDGDDESLLNANSVSENTVKRDRQQDGVGPVIDGLVRQTKEDSQPVSEAVSKKFAEVTEVLLRSATLAKESEAKLGKKLSNLERSLEEEGHERKNLEAMLAAMKEENVQLRRMFEDNSLKRKLESYDEAWRKEKAAMTGQLKEMQDQLMERLPSIISSSVTAATSAVLSVVHPLPKKPKSDPKS